MTNVNCPKCNHSFPIAEVLTEDFKKDLQEKMKAYKQKQDEKLRLQEEEFKKKEYLQKVEFDKKIEDEKRKINEAIEKDRRLLEENLKNSISLDYQTKLNSLKNSNLRFEEQLNKAREREIEYLNKEQQLKDKEAEIELTIRRSIQEHREKLTEQIRKEETEKHNLKETDLNLKVKELETQLEAQRKLAEEMKRKADQGSMQLQGEAQELILEELLRSNFPFDHLEEVPRGIKGADCILTIQNKFGQECGKIMFESKRTKEFSQEWIEKLKKDMRSIGVNEAVIVTKCYPKGMDCFGQKDDIWICSFEEVKAVTFVLRAGIIKLHTNSKSQENKGDKMHMLYDYLTSNEFSEQWKAIREGFMSMKLSIDKERDAMERLWKVREKQLEKVLLNASHIGGSIEGIAGRDNINFGLIDDQDKKLIAE